MTASIDHLKKVVSDFSDQGYKYINITGGEPFLLGHGLVELVSFAIQHGIGCRVTTGAYWSKNEKIASSKLKELANAGLRDLYISVSDGHLEYLSLDNLFYAAKAGRKHKMKVTIGLLSFNNAKLTIRQIIELFRSHSEPMPFINEAPVIPFGRAADNFGISALKLRPVAELDGPCPAVLNHPMVHPNGDVSACSSVLSHETSPLVFGNIATNSSKELCDKMNTNAFYIWIHQFGPYALKKMIESLSDVRFGDQYVNICHLCGDISNNHAALEVLRNEKFL